MPIVPIKGLFETHLTVANLDRSIEFYRDVVGLELAHTVPERHAAFFWVGAQGQTMLGLWSIHSSPLCMRLHVAFDVAEEHVEASIGRLRDAGIEPRHAGKPMQEPVVISWMPAASVFFDDPDGHRLEFIAMLEGPSNPDWGWIPLSDWRARTLSD